MPAATTAAPPPTQTPEVALTQPAFEAVPLGPIVNASLSEDFVSPPTGSQVFTDVPFKLDGRVFKSQASPSPNINYPQSARLVVELPRPKSVYVLLAAGNGFFQWSGNEIGRIRLEFAEGVPVTVELVLGQNIREWHSGENLAAAAPEITEAWRGPIAGHPELTGWLDMLTIELPAAACDDALTAIEIADTSQITLGNADPAVTIAGLSVAFCPGD
jgi:hypothetical protein